MRTIIFTAGTLSDTDLEFENLPGELLPLIDRPFIQHVVENLIEAGIRKFDFIMCRHPEKFEKLFGDGTRWGCEFKFHLTRRVAETSNVLRALALTAESSDEKFLPVRADRFSAFSAEMPSTDAFAGLEKMAISADTLSDSELKLESLFDKPQIPAKDDQNSTPNFYSAENCAALLNAQKKFFAANAPRDLLTAREIERGVWFARNVSLHPTAKINAPVFIGENCRIAADAEVGPNAVLGANCLIEKKCAINNSLVLADSYVGENLEVADSLLGGGKIINTRLGAEIEIPDQFILGSLREREIKRFFVNFLSRFAAFFLLLFSLPVLIFTFIWLKITRRGGRVMQARETVLLPTNKKGNRLQTFRRFDFSTAETTHNWETGDWREIFLKILPALINVARGEMRFVGVRPLDREQVAALPADWREFYVSSKTGIITEAFVFGGASVTSDDRYLSESVYAVSADWRTDLKILRSYIKNFSRNYFSRSPRFTNAEKKMKLKHN